MRENNGPKLFWKGLFIANLTVLIVFWLANSGPLLASGSASDVLIALGRISGLLLMYLMLVQLVLVSRVTALESPYGFDALNRLHQKLGFSLLALVILHPLLLTLGYAGGTTKPFDQFLFFQEHWEGVLPATIGAFLMITAGVLSMKRIRAFLRYETWYFSHVFLYVAIALSLGHQTNTGDMSSGGAFYYWYALTASGFGALIAYRFFRPAYTLWKHRFRIARVIKESESSYSVYITGRRMNEFRFEAGQFAHFIFFQKGKWQHHPFSFSAPYNGTELRITVKRLGDFTEDIAALTPGTMVWIDGPLGRFTIGAARKEKYCLIAGGVGVTPVAALIRSLTEPHRAVVLVSNRKRTDAPLLDELEATGSTVRPYFSEEDGVRIDAQEVFRTCPDVLDRDVFLCGPAPMMLSIANGLAQKGMPREQIHYELFSY